MFPIRYIAVLGFQLPRGIFAMLSFHGFQSAISRYLVSNMLDERMDEKGKLVSIRYIAVLGFQQLNWLIRWSKQAGFNPLYRGTWFPTEW